VIGGVKKYGESGVKRQRFPDCGEIMPLSRGRRGIGDMLFCEIRSNYICSKAFTTKASRRNGRIPEK
jgi:hypothetical protein